MTERRLAIAPPSRTDQAPTPNEPPKERLAPLTIDTSGFSAPAVETEPPAEQATTSTEARKRVPAKKPAGERQQRPESDQQTATKSRLTLSIDSDLVDALYRRRDETSRTLAALVLDDYVEHGEEVAADPTVEENRRRRELGLSPIRRRTEGRRRHLVLFVTPRERELLEEGAEETNAASVSEYVQLLLR